MRYDFDERWHTFRPNIILQDMIGKEKLMVTLCTTRNPLFFGQVARL